jgi:hypothetical protein
MKKLFKRSVGKIRLDLRSALALALLPGIFLMVLQYIFLEFNVYEWYFPQLDIPMHIMGGATVAWAAWALLSYAIGAKKLPSLPFWFAVAFAVGIAATVGILWEFYEFVTDVVFNTHGQMWQFGPGDTMKDFANDLMGAFLLSVLVGRKMLKK